MSVVRVVTVFAVLVCFLPVFSVFASPCPLEMSMPCGMDSEPMDVCGVGQTQGDFGIESQTNRWLCPIEAFEQWRDAGAVFQSAIGDLIVPTSFQIHDPTEWSELCHAAPGESRNRPTDFLLRLRC